MKIEIEKFDLCEEAIHFRNQYSDFQTAWNNCHMGDWMLWWAKKLNVDNRKLTLAKGLCANTVINLMKDERSRKAVKVAIDYGKCKLTKKELIAAAADADDAAAAAASFAAEAASFAAEAASFAAEAASFAAEAAEAAEAAAEAAAYATAEASAYANAAAAYAADASFAAAYAAINKNRKETANICREILTNDVFKLIKLKS
jgi:hypothetical protein